MTEYILVSDLYTHGFIETVNALLREGWSLHGAPFFRPDEEVLIQAMTREVKRHIPPPPDEPIEEPVSPEVAKARFDEMRAALSK